MNDFPEKDYELIDQYIGGQLSEGDRMAFERRLLNEPALAAEVEWLKKLYVNYEHVRLEDTVRDIHRSLKAQGVLNEEEKETIVRPLWRTIGLGRFLAVAASVAAVVVAGFWIWQHNQTPTGPSVAVTPPPTRPPADTSRQVPDSPIAVPPTEATPSLLALVQEYANQPPHNVGNVPSALNAAVADYEAGQLRDAIAQLRKPVGSVTDSPSTKSPEFGAAPEETKSAVSPETAQTGAYRRFYLGLSYLKNGQPRQALAELERVNRFPLTQTTQWYRALSHLQLNQTDQAVRLLNQIRQTEGHPYQIEATNLATKLTAQSRP